MQSGKGQNGKFNSERRMPGCIKGFGKVKRDDVNMCMDAELNRYFICLCIQKES